MRKTVLFLFSAGLLLTTNDPAIAVVGPSVPGDAVASAVVMVLSRWAGGAGFCSGTVVAKNVILSAAHCLAAPSNMRVYFRKNTGGPVFMSVAASAVHPLYRADAQKARERSVDLALLRTVVPLPRRFQAVTLDHGTAITIGSRLRIAGFGVTQEGAATSSGKLRVGRLEVRAPLSSVLLWADDPAHAGAGACTGDSGGPILAATSEVVIAVTDWAAGRGARHCGALTQGALVAPQRGWIESVLRSWGEPVPP